ncbi:MAG: hypothetical protein K0R75_821 [Paenibacillaceae bacterium]|nr:hypothetical protein [Paenibacillaceae bacterium]
MHQLTIIENGVHLVVGITEDADIRLLHVSASPYPDTAGTNNKNTKMCRLLEVHVTGEDQDDHHGSKHTGSMPGNRLKYSTHRDYRNHIGRKIEFFLRDEISGLEAVVHWQFYDGIAVFRTWTLLTNRGDASLGIEYVTSFAYTGLADGGQLPWAEKMKLYVPHNSWCGELQWQEYRLAELGLKKINPFSTKRIQAGATGTGSTSEFLPMGLLENTETGTSLFWQIEHNGSWHWEISDAADKLYLHLSGPAENEHSWWKTLAPGESFQSVPAAVGAAPTPMDRAFAELTQYRRAMRRPNEDNEQLSVIFNDYMNCLNADSTTEKLLPYIHAAAEAGCEYFCIDAGWYSDGHWWDSVGRWMPSERRYPEGLPYVLNYIRSKGMIPGLWLELEVMGVKCDLAATWDDGCFFVRHGKRVIDHGRYQLDYRHPKVIEHANAVVDRLVKEYGVGYIKMDYNINAGSGTIVGADSFGDGLLQHNRAYLAWLDSLFARYPGLVIENCGSGGMRMDYAMLEKHSIQSVTDQTDYRKHAAIAAASPTAVTPEQAAVWAYPLANGDREEVIFNMVNAMLLRILLSGQLADMSSELRLLVKQGIDCYKSLRQDIKRGVPFWPLGRLPGIEDDWLCLGLSCAERTYLSVWRMDTDSAACRLPIAHLQNRQVSVRCAYPLEPNCEWGWELESGVLNVAFPCKYTARVFEMF